MYVTNLGVPPPALKRKVWQYGNPEFRISPKGRSAAPIITGAVAVSKGVRSGLSPDQEPLPLPSLVKKLVAPLEVTRAFSPANVVAPPHPRPLPVSGGSFGVNKVISSTARPVVASVAAVPPPSTTTAPPAALPPVSATPTGSVVSVSPAPPSGSGLIIKPTTINIPKAAGVSTASTVILVGIAAVVAFMLFKR